MVAKIKEEGLIAKSRGIKLRSECHFAGSARYYSQRGIFSFKQVGGILL
jgi:hypothetical protein